MIIPYAPAALAERVVPSSMDRQFPNIRREVTFDDGAKQVWEKWDNYIITERHSLDVTDTERQEVIDFYERVKFSWFRYARSDIGCVFARFVMQPGDVRLRDTIGEYWSMPVMLEFWAKGRKGYWEGDRRVKKILSLGFDQVAADDDTAETFPNQILPFSSNSEIDFSDVLIEENGEIWLENFSTKNNFYGMYFDLRTVEDGAILLFIAEANRLAENKSLLAVTTNDFSVLGFKFGTDLPRTGIALTMKRAGNKFINVLARGGSGGGSGGVGIPTTLTGVNYRINLSTETNFGNPIVGNCYESFLRPVVIELWGELTKSELYDLVDGVEFKTTSYTRLVSKR